MGFGDALIASGIARKARQKHPDKPICIGTGSEIEWNEVFDGNPNISREVVPGAVWVHSYKSFRPYVDYAKTTAEKFAWQKDFKATPGELYLRDDERRWEQSGFVYIEPNIKGWCGPNKDWGFDRWQEVVDLLPEVRFLQGPGRKLNNVEQVETESFRDACALLDRADLFVGTDGGLHHAAAALGKRAVVIWGGFTHPRNLGYDTHINLHSGAEPCGSLRACKHCDKAMAQIRPAKVAEKIRECLGRIGTDPHAGKAKEVQEGGGELPQDEDWKAGGVGLSGRGRRDASSVRRHPA